MKELRDNRDNFREYERLIYIEEEEKKNSTASNNTLAFTKKKKNENREFE